VSTRIGEQAKRAPSVDVRQVSGSTRAVALVLPGGKAHSFDPADPGQLTAVRMRPYAAALHRGGRDLGLAVWTVRYRYRGWNAPESSPVADTRWALDEVRRRHGEVPVVVVGHSMGGRTALRVADDPSVRGVCALAPWTERGDPVSQLAGRSVLVAHGNLDLVTSARASHRFAERAREVTSPVGRVVVWGDTHAMLFRWRTWHRLATTFALGTAGLASMPRRLERIFAKGAAGDLAVPV
jgi:pimeloyl-ACP methyl ester carboxylesterase